MTDPLQSAVEVLARALGRFTAAEWQDQMEFSKIHGLDVPYAKQARALLAEIAPMIVADSDRRRANHAKLYASRGTE